MSVECMSRVFKKSASTGNDRFVLLAIADNAWEDGTNSWPSVALIAWKTGLSERTVRRCLDNLEKLGELRRDYRTGTSTMYSVLISDKKPDRPRPEPSKKNWELDKGETPKEGKTPGTELAVSSQVVDITTGTRAPKKVDDVWNAVMDVCQIDQSTLNTSERKKFGSCCKLLRESKATPDEIYIRAKRYKEKYEGAALTPPALVNHWSSLAVDLVSATKQVPQAWDAIAEARKQRGV